MLLYMLMLLLLMLMLLLLMLVRVPALMPFLHQGFRSLEVAGAWSWTGFRPALYVDPWP
jgi:hypothetical protein